ncbi:MAG TPA: response regulator transcription factor [Usitatibacter sp.]|nr:response regulator transcription factor [Usitatibacter sp.]
MIRALVVVEVPFYREGLAELLNKGADVKVVASAGSAAAAEALAVTERPDVVLIDASLADAAASIERMRTLSSPPKFVALAVNETPDAVLKWAELGVAAYVPRSATPEELLRVLKGVVQEEFYCSPQMAAHLVHHVAVLASASRRPGDAFEDLSPREHEVLSLMARGLPNKAIANTLSISHATAKNHVHKILEKLRLHRRSEVASLLHGASQRR